MADTIEQSDQKGTKAGNYFIANYPPFSFWNEKDLSELDAVMETPAPADIPLGVYYHIPFCRKRCHFCYFRVYTDKNASEIKHYIDTSMREFRRHAERPYVVGRKPKFVYFGGGTPSYLSGKQLQSLTSQMQDILPWDEVEEVTFECEPGTLNSKKLEAIRGLGITRLSLGIENFSDHILDINGRAHRSKEVHGAYQAARDLEFPQINIDLIAGMLEETEENWQRNIEKTLELSPDCVTIYQMEVPYNTGIYKDMKASGKLVAPIADWPTKRRWVAEAFAALEANGYTVTSTTTAVKDPDNTRFLYRDMLWTGADLLAAGVASFGHFGGVHYQNLTHFESYVQALDEGRQPATRALFTTKEERMIREFILQMKLGTVGFGYFREKFGDDLRKRFAKPLEHLEAEGFASALTDDQIMLTRDALLQVDSLLPDFFLPRHQGARYT